MKLRNASVLVLLLAATAACKGSDKTPAKQTGSAPGPAQVDAASAAAADPWTQPAPKKDPLKQPLLWSIEKDGKTSYALGTMHMGVDPQEKLPELVWQKLDEAKTFAMEADIAQAAKLHAMILRKDKTTLRQELGDEYWKKLEDALGVGEAARMLPFKPMIAAAQLSKLGLPETAAMDGVLHGRALNQKKNIVFLESIEHQGAVLMKWMTAQALKDMLDDVPGLTQRGKDMLAAYLAGDGGKILAIAEAERTRWKEKGRPEKEYDEQMEDLLYKRNASWIAPIEKMHKEGGAFIAVGALHLVGPRSVLELLEKKGYKVTRLTP